MMKELTKLAETPEIQKLYNAYYEWHHPANKDDRVESCISTLREAKEYIPIESHEDYRQAILNAHAAYCRKMLMETLPVVYEEYMECLHTGKKFSWVTNPYDDEPAHPFKDNNDPSRRILAARKARGEPENFDFLKKENLKL